MSSPTSPFAPFLDPKHQAVIFQNDKVVAYLEQRPIVRGHVVLFVKSSDVDHWWDLEQEKRDALFHAASEIAKILKQTYPCEKVALAALGLVTRQAHIHLLPMNDAKEFRFDAPRIELSPEDLQKEILRLRIVK